MLRLRLPILKKKKKVVIRLVAWYGWREVCVVTLLPRGQIAAQRGAGGACKL